MNIFNRLMSTAAINLAVGLTSIAAIAETPANMLVIANRIDDITTIDPAQSFEFAGSDVSRNIYNKLVNFDPINLDAGYQPDLAESWTVSADGRTITFTMREGVKFHSGNPVRAKDAEFSLRRVVTLNKTPSFICCINRSISSCDCWSTVVVVVAGVVSGVSPGIVNSHPHGGASPRAHACIASTMSLRVT